MQGKLNLTTGLSKDYFFVCDSKFIIFISRDKVEIVSPALGSIRLSDQYVTSRENYSFMEGLTHVEHVLLIVSNLRLRMKLTDTKGMKHDHELRN